MEQVPGGGGKFQDIKTFQLSSLLLSMERFMCLHGICFSPGFHGESRLGDEHASLLRVFLSDGHCLYFIFNIAQTANS